MLSLADALTVLDSVAAGVALVVSTFGAANDGGTVSGAAAANATLLASRDDVSVQADLTPIFYQRQKQIVAGAVVAALRGRAIQRAMDVHYGTLGSLNAFLASNDARVHANLRQIGFSLDARVTMPDVVVDPLARYDGTGVGSGTFTSVSAINTTLFGETPMQVVVEVMGGSARTLTISVQRFDGGVADRVVIVPANSVAGATVAIPGRGVGVAAIVSTGGTAADRLRVRSTVERVIAL